MIAMPKHSQGLSGVACFPGRKPGVGMCAGFPLLGKACDTLPPCFPRSRLPECALWGSRISNMIPTSLADQFHPPRHPGCDHIRHMWRDGNTRKHELETFIALGLAPRSLDITVTCQPARQAEEPRPDPNTTDYPFLLGMCAPLRSRFQDPGLPTSPAANRHPKTSRYSKVASRPR